MKKNHIDEIIQCKIDFKNLDFITLNFLMKNKFVKFYQKLDLIQYDFNLKKKHIEGFYITVVTFAYKDSNISHILTNCPKVVLISGYHSILQMEILI